MQALIANLAKLAVDLKVAATLGQHSAGFEQQLVQVVVQHDVLLLQFVRYGLVAPLFVHAILLIGVYCADPQVLAQFADHLRCGAPVIGLADQQRHIQLGQRRSQLTQVAQPEVDLAGRVVMRPPLPGAEQEQRQGRSGAHGGGEGAVVLHAQVAAKPHQLVHGNP